MHGVGARVRSRPLWALGPPTEPPLRSGCPRHPPTPQPGPAAPAARLSRRPRGSGSLASPHARGGLATVRVSRLPGSRGPALPAGRPAGPCSSLVRRLPRALHPLLRSTARRPGEERPSLSSHPPGPPSCRRRPPSTCAPLSPLSPNRRTRSPAARMLRLVLPSPTPATPSPEPATGGVALSLLGGGGQARQCPPGSGDPACASPARPPGVHWRPPAGPPPGASLDPDGAPSPRVSPRLLLPQFCAPSGGQAGIPGTPLARPTQQWPQGRDIKRGAPLALGARSGAMQTHPNPAVRSLAPACSA